MKRILIAFAVFSLVASIGLVAGVGSAEAQSWSEVVNESQTGDVRSATFDEGRLLINRYNDSTTDFEIAVYNSDGEKIQSFPIQTGSESAYANGDGVVYMNAPAFGSDNRNRYEWDETTGQYEQANNLSRIDNNVAFDQYGRTGPVTSGPFNDRLVVSAGEDTENINIAKLNEPGADSSEYSTTGSKYVKVIRGNSPDHVVYADGDRNLLIPRVFYNETGIYKEIGDYPDYSPQTIQDVSKYDGGIAVLLSNNTIQFLDGDTYETDSEIQVPSRISNDLLNSLSISPNQEYAYIYDFNSKNVEVFDLDRSQNTIDSVTNVTFDKGEAYYRLTSSTNGFVIETGNIYGTGDDGYSYYQPPKTPTNLDVTVEETSLNLSEDGPTDFNFSGTITYDDGSTEPLTSDKIGIVAYTSGVIDVDTTNLTYSISPDFDGDPDSTDFSVTLADSNVSANSPTITVDYRPAEPVVSNLTLEQSAIDTDGSETVTGTFRLKNNGDLETNVTLYQGVDGFNKSTTSGSVTYNTNTTGSYSFDVPSAEGNYTANVTSISEDGFTSTTTADMRVVNVSGPTVEITSIETTDNEPYNDPKGTVTISVKHNSLNDSVRSASISPNFTATTQQVSFGEIPALGTATETVTLDDQPPEENLSADYGVITDGDSATFTINNVIGTPSLSNLRNPVFSNMDRVIAVLGDTTLIILFLITGASAMVSKETSGSIGSAMFMLLLLPAWLAVGVPLYLFGVAIPAVVIIYQQSQSDQPAQEIRIEGMR